MPATQENEIAITVYAPALVGNDGRPLAVVHGMERALPGLRLEWTISRSLSENPTVEGGPEG